MSVVNFFSEELRFVEFYPKEDFEKDWLQHQRGQALEDILEQLNDDRDLIVKQEQEIESYNGPRIREIRNRFRKIQEMLVDYGSLLQEVKDLSQESHQLEVELAEAKAKRQKVIGDYERSFELQQRLLITERHKFYRAGLLKRAKKQASKVKEISTLVKHELGE